MQRIERSRRDRRVKKPVDLVAGRPYHSRDVRLGNVLFFHRGRELIGDYVVGRSIVDSVSVVDKSMSCMIHFQASPYNA